MGEGDARVTEAIGKHGVGARNAAGERNLEFAGASNMAIVNTSFRKGM